MRRYWPRMVTAIGLSLLFGLSNVSFIWVINTLFTRMAAKSSEMVSVAVIHQAPATVMVKYHPGEALIPVAVITNVPVTLLTTNQGVSVLVTNGTDTSQIVTPDQNIKQRIKAAAIKLKAQAESYLDPWLPLRGRTIDWKQVFGGILILPLFVGVSRYLGYMTTYCTNWVNERIIADVRVAVLAKLQTLSLDYFNRSTLGDLSTRITTDTAMLQRCLSLGLNDIIKEPITVTAVFCGLFMLSPTLTLMAVFFLPLCILPLVILSRKVRKAVGKLTTTSIEQANLMIDALTAIRVVKAFGMEERQLDRYKELAKKSVHYTMKMIQARELVNPLIEVAGMTGVGVMVVFVFWKDVQLPELMGFLTGVVVMFTPMKKLANIPVFFAQASVGVNRLVQVIEEQPSVKEPSQPKPFKSFAGGLAFENVTFTYGHAMVLDRVTLNIPRGFRLGIAGESGCGKSTLVNLAFRFYDPTGGTIKIDGMDLREITSKDLRHQMAMVSQEIVLFDQTIADNIRCGRDGATREEIEFAAKQAYAHDFIMKQEHGYETMVGERGCRLSVGQRQRLCIARAFVRNAPILILDEATASLDSQAEAEVQAAIDRLEENRTVICIAHRLSTLAAMDKIIVLAKGRIVESGTFPELLQKGGLFAEMARKQAILA